MRRLKRYLQLGIILLAMITYIIACQKPVFSPSESAVIGSRHDGIMPVLTVADADDSLFLHRSALRLTPRQVSSEQYAALKKRMLATVSNPENSGVGLAAPQVGISYRLIVVKRSDLKGSPWKFYINPEITSYSADTTSVSEGCFSIPDTRTRVPRSNRIEIRYNDELTFTYKKETVVGFEAIVFQHEIDHLNGILMTDTHRPQPVVVDYKDNGAR